ncbi:MAG: 3-hydroxyacyl-CoA dehydrogenase NAD-binding domain-containing protein [Thermoanaerobaculales bacterium]|jgi:3-hydroxyacyl-CoA dehydrogenase/enoyl-CoA hydratase/carnithine racemase|nr:3-hydroxyacyl-CoA dehydrogenase NAD-binding domain-containing protein [Thermoanaerobaculales bacterium]
MIRIDRRDDGVAMVWLDHPDKPVNTLTPATVAEFNDQVLPLMEDDSVRAFVVVSAKQDTFIAGADLDVIEGLDAEQISQMSSDGNALLEAIHTGPKPVVAAVHGAAIGGGMEVALGCNFILASDDPRTVFTQAEVMLGLLPAGGGTQRLVERAGLAAALPMLLTGKRVRARRAKRMGIVDALTTPGGIAETAARAALAMAEGKLQRPVRKKTIIDRLSGLAPVRAKILAEAAKQVGRTTRGNYPAPTAILDCVETGLKKGRLAGLDRESHYFGILATGMESRNLVRLFHAMNEAKKTDDGPEPRPVDRLAVIGAGFMGAGVASLSLAHSQVVLKDISDDALGAGFRTIEKGLKIQTRSGAISRREADRRRSALRLTTDTADLAGADLAIEAVFEDLDLKRRVIAEVEEVIPPEAAVASNTSALPIAKIAEGARHPERILGMHYFSPVPKMPLLEIVVAETTAGWATATAKAYGTAQGKTCIVVKDGPGFYTTRILAPYLNEAVVLLEEGAKIEDLDRVMKDFGYPVGPVALMDEVGIDVGAHVAADLGAAFAERGLGASDALPKMYEAGFEGRKNGKGFYLYPKKKKKGPKPINTEVYGFFGGPERRSVAADEIRDRMALLMVNEAVHCLDDGVIASPRDGDLGAILGLGFPPFRGGPFRWVDHEGAASIVDRMNALAERHGQRFEPAGGLRKLASNGELFYREG